MEEKKSLQEFRSSILKIKNTRIHKVHKSYCIRDAYRWLYKNKWLRLKSPITELEFGEIIRAVNHHLAEKLLNNGKISLPYEMGYLEMLKYDRKVWMQDNNVRTNVPINWDATLKLWYEDEEAKNNKTLIRAEAKELIRIRYKTSNVIWKNKSFFKWYFSSELRKEISKRFREGNIDSVAKMREYGMGRFIVS